MIKTLTKAEIVEKLVQKLGKDRQDAKDLLEKLIEIVKKAIKKDNELLISGFGKFECYDKRERRGRNPQTSEALMLSPRKVLVFRLSRKFRTELDAIYKQASN